MRWLAALLLCSLLPPATAAGAGETDTGARDCVILLHGLGRSSLSMFGIAGMLTDAGYRVINSDYDSRAEDIAGLATTAIPEALARCAAQDVTRIHFVTHSLGGILVRQYLQNHDIAGLGRIVMLAPPNRGSEVADLLKDYTLYRFATGPAGQELGTGAQSVPLQLRPIPGEIGVITGNSSSDPWFSPSIPGEDDGKVSVQSARLPEMRDFLVVDDGHTFIMFDGEVQAQVLHFLQTGRFMHKTTVTPP